MRAEDARNERKRFYPILFSAPCKSAAEELKRLEGLRKAQVEMGRLEEKEKPVSKNMFKAI